MAERVEQMLALPIQLADQVSKTAAEADSFKQECLDLKKQTDKLSALLRQAARASGGLYERPTGRITEEITKVLQKAVVLVTKCSRRNGMIKRVFTITSAAAFRKMGFLLDSSIGDVTWLLNVSANGEERGEHLGLPPIATNDPMLGLIWEQIARLQTGSAEEKADAAASLVSLAQDSERNGKLIVEEGGIPPLLRLLKEGTETGAGTGTVAQTVEGQEAAAKALGKLGKDPERVQQMIRDGVCSVFSKVLKEGPMKVQSTVAWALSELLSHDPASQDHFAQSGIIRSLVGHLAFETVQESNKYVVAGAKAMSMHSVVTAAKTAETHGRYGYHNVNVRKDIGIPSLSGLNLKGREAEDPATKAAMKTEAAKALWMLAKDNVKTCKSITESKALVCFAILLEKGKGLLQYNSAMAVMEIAAVAEQNAELRRSTFKTNSPAAKALVDQLLRIIEGDDSELLVPCIKAIGSLARTFPARETRLIAPLVKHLDHRDLCISTEAAVALAKFACTENFLHLEHSKAIIEASAAPHLIQLVYFGEGVAQVPALILLCYLALHVGDSEALAKAEALSALEWTSKQVALIQDPTLEKILPEAKSRLELYQSRGGFRFH
uniref:TSA: Wollemia nobilis Ref_Wollemi_Transcript_7128_2215 transcribed RNA sequence n=1 Tax=Wollemia nobilis TaxID=56998 RepID=A0A0C9S9Q4_9CONI